MDISEKLDYLNNFCKNIGSVWVVAGDSRWRDSSGLPAWLKDKSHVNNEIFSKLELLRKSHNIWYYKNRDKPLNKEGILYINLLYKILKTNNL